MVQTSDSVAIYWDFENLHANLLELAHGPGAYSAARFRPQEELVDVATIVEYALSLGPIAINRAFANWVSFNRYRQSLLQAAIELIQVFPPGANAKNGADIKLCLDVMDDMARFPHLGTIIVVGGDSDYMPLSYKVKAAGRTLVGIGSRRGTNPHWARSCHEFKFYETLLAPTPITEPEPTPTLVPAPALAATPAPTPVPPTALPLAEGCESPPSDSVAALPRSEGFALPVQRVEAGNEPPAPAHSDGTLPLEEMRALLDIAEAAAASRRAARELVVKAIKRLAQNRGDAWVQKARLRPFIQRVDSTFHETSYGFSTFNEMLSSMGDLLEVRRGEFDHELRLKPVGLTHST